MRPLPPKTGKTEDPEPPDTKRDRATYEDDEDWLEVQEF